MATNPKSIPKVQTTDRNVNQLQTNILGPLNGLLQNEIVNNNFLTGVTITSGNNSINHLLGRMNIGWVISDIIGTYVFTVTSANATIGATYSNNTNPIQSFTVLSTISGQTTLYANGSGTPTSSGTLTKTGGTGDSTISFSSFKYVAANVFRSAPFNDVTLTLASDIPTVVNLMVF